MTNTNNAAATTANLGPATETVVYDAPAYEVVRRTGAFGNPVAISTADRLGLLKPSARYGTLVHQYSPGSVVSYALRTNQCPIRAAAEETARGHALHWLNACGSMITREKRAKQTLVLVEVGMVIRFEGRTFTVVAQPNDNLGLVEVAE